MKPAKFSWRSCWQDLQVHVSEQPATTSEIAARARCGIAKASLGLRVAADKGLIAVSYRHRRNGASPQALYARRGAAA